MSKIKIEVVEAAGFMDGLIKREFGDIFSTEQGQYFVDLGWAKNVETGEVGDRVEGVSKIKPNKVVSTF